MAALAAQVFAQEQATEVVVAQDAHMSEVYLGIYRQDGGTIVDVVPERLHAVDEVLQLLDVTAEGRVAAGFGWQRYPDLLAAHEHLFERLSEFWHPSARYLPAMAAKRDAIRPQDLTPAYLRQKVAEKPGPGP